MPYHNQIVYNYTRHRYITSNIYQHNILSQKYKILIITKIKIQK